MDTVQIVEFRILGSLEFESDGRIVPVPGGRSRRLLASLLLNANVVISQDRLIDALWPDPPATARQQVHTAVSSLRRLITGAAGDVELVTSDAGYRLRLGDDQLDVTRYRAQVRQAEQLSSGQPDEAIRLLRDALALWRGAPLEGLANSQSLVDAAAHLTEQRVDAIERLVALQLRHGDPRPLIAELVEWVAEFPLQESLRAGLMAALYNNGRPADALAVYDDVRQVLAEELGVDPGPRLRRVHRVVLQGQAEALDDEGNEIRCRKPPTDVTGFAADAPLRPLGRCFLPRAARDFAGRKAEIGVLLREAAQAAPSALVVTPIDGMGGVGKTTLAVQVAHQMIGEYPDGQYFVDLHGFSEGIAPVATADALDLLLQDAGVAAELVPSDLDRRSALWRSEMAGKRALVLLDNAVDAAQVRALLPGASQILVIITSRRRLTALEGAVPLSLDVLAHEEAVELFLKITGADRTAGQDDAVSQVVELCGRLPLAVSIAAARLRDRVSWTVSYLVEQLSDQRRRHQILAVGDRSVWAVLTLSYRYLTEPQQRLLRLLSLHPGADFDAYATSALAEISLDDAADALESLFEDSLLLQHAPGRYQFHDLVRDCSHQLLHQTDSEQEIAAARHRLLDYYLCSAHTWSAALAKGPFRFEPEVRWVPALVKPAPGKDPFENLRVEYRNVVALARLALADGWHQQSWQLVCALQPFLKQLNYKDEALDLFQGALRSARAVANRRAESACLTGVALVLRERHLGDAASESLEQAIQISREEGDTYSELFQLADLGVIKLNDVRIAEAYEHFRRAARMAAETKTHAAEAAIENNLGVICVDLGRTEEALQHFEKALSYYRKTDAQQAVTQTEVNIGVTLCREGDYAAAVDRLLGGLELSRIQGIPRAQGWALAGLSVAYRATADLDRSLDCGREALAIARRGRILDVECEALAGIAETFMAKGDPIRAAEVYRNTEEVAREHGLVLIEARVREGYAHLAAAEGDSALARRLWAEALQLYPAQAADAANARRHLQGLETGGAADCLRCVR